MDTKVLGISEVQVRFTAASTMQFEGYASKFGGVDAYGDTIDPRAYDRTIKQRNRDKPIRMRWNHWGPVIGKWVDIGTDHSGLIVRGELTPGHSVAQDVYASLKHGAVDGLSIGFRPKKIEMLEGGGRLLKEIDLIEISVVEEPADLGAKIGDVKALLDEALTLKEIEAVLRDAARFSKSDACALVSRIRTLVRGEHEAERVRAAELRRMFQQFD